MKIGRKIPVGFSNLISFKFNIPINYDFYAWNRPFYENI